MKIRSNHSEPLGQWKEATVGAVRIRYLVRGEGQPLVLLHGLSGSVRWWKHNIPALSARFQVLALDLFYYPHHPTERKFELHDAARKLRSWLTSIGVDRASFIGHSMGGAIASEFAADFPGAVDKLILVDPAIVFLDTPLRLSPWSLLRYSRWLPLSLLPTLVEDAWLAGPQSLLRTSWALLTRDLREKISRVQATPLILWGENDGILPLTLSAEVAALFPGSEVLIFEGAGHNPMWEQPGPFNAVATAFLTRPEAQVAA